jgi:hypothetical protein
VNYRDGSREVRTEEKKDQQSLSQATNDTLLTLSPMNPVNSTSISFSVSLNFYYCPGHLVNAAIRMRMVQNLPLLPEIN